MKTAAVIFALLLGVGCAHQGSPGGSQRGTGTSIETSVGSTTVDGEVTSDIEETPERPITRDVPDESGPGTRGQLGVNSPTQGRTTTGQETNFLLNKDRGSVRSATDRFRPGGDYSGVDDQRNRILLTPGLDQGSAPETDANGDASEGQTPEDGAKPAPGLSDPPNSQSGDSVPRADNAQQNSNTQVAGKAPAGERDELAGVRAISVAPYRSGSSFRSSALSGSSASGIGSAPAGVSGSSSGFESGEIRTGVRSTTATRFGTISSDVPAPGLSTAFSTGRETSLGHRQDRASAAYSDDPERRVGSDLMGAVGTSAGTDISRGLPIEALRNIDINSQDGNLTLQGVVGSDSERLNVENRVREAVGLRTINNQLRVSPGQVLPGESQIAPTESRAE
ncbi:MAG TPA: BON domain-containing protein [Methylomirabilota bacterium]|nr:BON domain-containing protein [Methylomirabilota bacterium]